jgi:hypothetical protein
MAETLGVLTLSTMASIAPTLGAVVLSARAVSVPFLRASMGRCRVAGCGLEWNRWQAAESLAGYGLGMSWQRAAEKPAGRGFPKPRLRSAASLGG